MPGLGRVLADLPSGVAISVAVHLPQILLTAMAWRVLLPPGRRPGLAAMAQLRWFRESANALLPAGALVGQAAAARLLARRGVPGEMAGATATVDLTLEAVSQLVFTLAGIGLLLAGGADRAMASLAVAGLGVAALGAFAMVLAQRHLGPLEALLRLLARRWPALRPEWIGELQQAVRRLHTDRGALVAALLWHGAAWVLGAVEIMGVLGLLGHPVSLADALVIESLAQALRNVGFMLPGALAVQEGAIIGAAALVGVPPAAALAAALIRRTREVAFGLPGLVAWHRSEVTGARARIARRGPG
ncbi:lysylphosphatidylglycerol synthase domain-containing protein [Siccirubricoccus sp. G192]|uniref:lysylphosphatidylglycerol synthase domain-containing protein n=1 Tax=Siccirubricoccus sp. G192 TaxID=2849651 RepID=UPI001C2C5FAA|nr:lysylphosphatidylglycerol synthase domain-containing protein [Siccirubricoccus sp. G192]MBV1798551.1 flippase-like domain-containing protein [Siccirubricoccus sp. G192]